MMTGTTYDSKHSYKDFGLIRSARPVISSPTVKRHIIDNPGGNGDIDVSLALYGVPMYNNRTITENYIFPYNSKKWDSVISDINQNLDGIEQFIVIDSDPWYRWLGTPLLATPDKSSETHMKLSVVSEVRPFKYERYSSAEDWLWDDLDFETGIIRDYRDIYIDGSLDFVIIGTKMPASPTFILSDVEEEITVNYFDYVLNHEETVNLSKSEDTSGLIMREGENILHFSGTGYVTINYRGGIL